MYTRDNSSATRKVFHKEALKKSDISKSARVISSNSAMKTAIKNDNRTCLERGRHKQPKHLNLLTDFLVFLFRIPVALTN